MKRVAVIAIFMAVMASLFAFPGYATTYNPTIYNSYTDAVTYNGVTYNVRVTQLKALSEGTSLLPGGMETIMLVSLQMTNNTNSVKAATIPKLTIDLSDERTITDVFTYGGDFTLGLLSGGIGIFYPNSQFSLDNNKVVVPPNRSLYCVGAIGLPAQLSQDGSSTLDTGLRGVHLYDKSNYSVSDGNYSYGDPVDLSPVINYIDGIEGALNTSNNNTTTIINRLNNIITLLTYSGNVPTTTINNGFLDNTNHTYPNFNYRMDITRLIGKEEIISDEIEYDLASDSYIRTGTKRIPFYIKINIRNTESKVIRTYWQQLSYFLFPYNYEDYSIYVDYFDSNVYSNIYFTKSGTTLRENFELLHIKGTYGYIPVGTTYCIITGYIECGIDQTLSYPALNITDTNMSNSTPILVDDYYPIDEYSILRDLYLAYSELNGLDDIDDAADEINNKSESAHTQEQNYFTQNARAIQATGLSNYRFNGDQENGIGSVSHDFTLLWNSLGGFNSVYVFSLTLSLALMVLRHAPGAIRSSRRNKEE